MKFLAIFTVIATAASVQAQYYTSALRRYNDQRWGYLQSGYCINMGYDYFDAVHTENGFYTYVWLYSNRCEGGAQYRYPGGTYRFDRLLSVGSAASLRT